MSSRKGRTAALVAGAAVLVVAAGAGGAVAGHKVTSAQIKNNTIKSKDVHNHALRGKDLHAKTLSYAKLTPKARHALGSAQGAIRVNANGAVAVHSGALPEPTVTHPQAGVYCVRGQGWSDGVYVGTVLAWFDEPGQITVRYQESASRDLHGAYCGKGWVEVDTFKGSGSSDQDFMLAKVG